MRLAATCFGFSHPSSGSCYICFAKVITINNQLKYVVYRISFWFCKRHVFYLSRESSFLFNVLWLYFPSWL